MHFPNLVHILGVWVFGATSRSGWVIFALVIMSLNFGSLTDKYCNNN